VTPEEIADRIGLQNVDVFPRMDGKGYIAQIILETKDGTQGAYFLGLRGHPTEQEIADVRAKFELWKGTQGRRKAE
jgi:hypothetical protein